jgi:hypothetical protein
MHFNIYAKMHHSTTVICSFGLGFFKKTRQYSYILHFNREMRRKLCIAHSEKRLLLLVNAVYVSAPNLHKFLAAGRVVVRVPELEVEKVLQVRILAVLRCVRGMEESLM